MVGAAKFEGRIRGLVENLPDLTTLVEPLPVVRRVLCEQIAVLHRRVLAVARVDDVCRRLMTIPGVGPVVALTWSGSSRDSATSGFRDVRYRRKADVKELSNAKA